MKGYKAFDKDLKCQKMQFKVGKTYKIEGELVLCKNGFHFCENLFDVYNYYEKSENTRICEIETGTSVVKEDDKSATSMITIVRELTKTELLRVWINRNNSGDRNSGSYNSGNYNSGYYNSGSYNSGISNSGNYNPGDSNSGYYNSGDSNSGHYNSGDHNSGYSNSGSYNSGHYNSGNYNSGYYNSGNSNSGFFNTNEPTIRLFNKDSELTNFSDLKNKLYQLNIKPILQWVSESNMTEEEKKNNPSSKTTKGYLKNTGKIDWSKLTEENKKFLISLPNFDDNIFEQISGIRLLTPKTIKVSHNGTEFEIDLEKAKELGIIKS